MSPRTARTCAAVTATLLAASCLGPLFRGPQHWVVGAVAAVLVATGCGGLGRRARLPSAVVPLLTPLGLVGLLTAVGSPGNAVLGVVPSRATLSSLHALVVDGFADVRDYATPVPTTPGLVLLAVAGVYVVAALVDLLAVTAGRPVLAGLPLLALFAVPATLLSHGVGLLHFLLAALGWVLLLAVDGRDRLSQWGRVLGRQSADAQNGVLLGGAAGRVAGLSLATAAVLPLLLPTLGGGLFRSGGAGIGGEGAGGSVVVAPLVTVQGRLHEGVEADLFRVSTATPDYYRLTALDAFDGAQFTLVQENADADRTVNGPLAAGTPGLGPGIALRAVDAEVRVGDGLAEPYLPLPYSPTVVRIGGRWQLAPKLRTVFSVRDTTRGRTFVVHSDSPQPTPAQLRAAAQAWTPGRDAAIDRQLSLDTSVPASLTSRVRTTAVAVTAGSTTDYDRLLRLQAYFTGGRFRYDLAAPLAAGNEGIETFLTDRRGYCEQFASVFTLMARTLGVPTRVAVGFTPGRLAGKDEWRVTNKDAHAWPEAWFDGVGWVRFEPTPRGELGTPPSYLEGTPAVAAQPSAAASTTATLTPSARSSGAVRDPSLGEGDTSLAGRAGGAGSGRSGPPAVVVAGVAAVLALLASPALTRLLLRRRRVAVASGRGGRRGQRPGRSRGASAAAQASAAEGASAAAHAAWAEVVDTAADLRLTLPASESPRSTSRRLAGLLPRSAPSLAATERRGTSPTAAHVQPERTETLLVGGRRSVQDSSSLPLTAPGQDPAEVSLALDRVTRAEERARYAPSAGPAAQVHGGLATDALGVRRALLGAQPRGSRLRAVLLPASVLARVRGTVAEAADSTAAAAGRAGGVISDRLRGLLARG